MNPTHTQIITLMLVFSTAVIGFVSALLTFINSRLKEAESTEQKDRIYGHALSFGVVILFLAAWAVCAFLKSLWPVAGISLFFFILNCYWFVTSKSKIIKRLEIAILIVMASCSVLLVIMTFILKIAEILKGIVDILYK